MNVLEITIVLALLPQPTPESTGSIRERERIVRLELEAAQSGEFYFVVDISASTLRLGLRGVVLETFALDDVSLGRRLGANDSGEELLKLNACESAVAETTVDIIPGQPLPEQAPAGGAVSKLTLTCGAQLSIHFDSGSATGMLRRLRERIHLAGDPEANARLRIVVADEQLAALTAAMPPKSSWILAP